jgi:hypothetical protein
MIGKSLLYSAVFLGVDLLVYFSIYLLFALSVNGFSILEAVKDGGGWVVTRMIYLQAFTQLALIAAVRFYGLQSNLVVVVLVCVLAFLLPSLYFMKEISAFVNYFTVNIAHRQLGPGLALVVSTLVAWIVLYKFTSISKSLG